VAQPDVHTRVLGAERREDRGDVDAGDALLGAHDDGAPQEALYRGGGVAGRGRARQRAPGVDEHGAPDLGELDVARGPHEQRRAELPFERPDRGRQAGLRHHRAVGGACEMPFLGHCDEVLELTELHGFRSLGTHCEQIHLLDR
jgi:hypothetical protein